MGYCSSCGSWIPDDQGSSCSMCYGDIAYGEDGYYEDWAREVLKNEINDEKNEKDTFNDYSNNIDFF